MSKFTDSRVPGIRSRSIQRARALWTELDFAQRRMFELQTGVSVHRANDAHQLEQLYRQRSA